MSGNLSLGPKAVVQGDVAQVEGNIDQRPGAVIGGSSGSVSSPRLLGDLFRIFCLAPALLIGATVVLMWLWRRRRPSVEAGPSLQQEQ
jgi:hypothetical protein